MRAFDGVAVVATIGALVALMHACTGCGGSESDQHARNAERAALYEAQQMACVANASTKEESRTCRCAVRASYGRPCTDGGAP